MKKKYLKSLDRSGLKEYLFDEFEKVLPDEEYGIFVITILNKIRTDYIIERLLDVVEGSHNRSNGHVLKS
ncbi:MAG TPA: hypothetical protein QGG35_03245 [Candidatus Marinimicrobia bacterium]|jgi:hypothetical protein|nr:hypothetical protein [Candidatus Neomarinimicrobiota bacterium]MDP7122439.1 hypothetical protein [Candidatus Neomarinimicrobiota bacterium]MDP7436380.1 hypothetical protein [Candidatus Neomarinimicrobiota bacterium]MDP7528668.1 hypothetical protein [Candidatus Neomarinimicrobiota bacterium]MDP7715645.1 hypothetical protein [Candidatus Neomarinimicrobiota bacterium]|tara:strand:- start:1418 stop:1627 length:210 start_codon:yes stop_codon:yes gene_type:complete